MTTSYLDSYWEAADMAAFLPLLATQPNIIGPVMGLPEVAGSNPSHAYIAVRSDAPIEAPVGCVAADPSVAIQLLGVWA